MAGIALHPLSRGQAVLALALGAAALLWSTATADAAAQQDPTLSAGELRRVVNVKFVEGSDVRLRDERLVFLDNRRIAALDRALAGIRGVEVERLFESASESELAASERRAEARSGRNQDDMNLFFRIETDGADDTVELLERLNELQIVEVAAPEMKPVPPPATPDFASFQGYRLPAASSGVDADYAHSLAGGQGEHVTIVDLEYSWNRSHEDLSKARVPGSAINNATPCDPFNNTDHGTAVLGELGGDPNGFGVTGLAPGAALRTVNTATQSPGVCGWSMANAIQVATANTSLGDVILIEQQTAGPNFVPGDSQFGLVPVEWEQSGAVRAAIKNATSLGRIVVEAAGNGSQNLDDPVYSPGGVNWFSDDSGAIIVGAGNAPGCAAGPARSRLSFSNYGSAVDVQGWGNCVATTGYGDLQGTSGANDAYTGGFGGTSGASPIVAASAAVISSIAESRGSTITSATVRSVLATTGQAQAFGASGKIGPLPNLNAAIGAIGPKLADAGHVISGTNVAATTVPIRQSWTSSGSAAVRYEVWLSTDDGSFVKQNLASPGSAAAVFQLERNHSYQFAARAVDAAGLAGPWVYGSKFNLGQYQENYATGNPAYSGTWTRSAWQPALDGNVSVSSTPGDKATFSFTGNNIAWLASKSTNRGQARVYIDGTLVKTVDLYANTTSARAIAFSHAWPMVGAHTITVEVVGTGGRPKVDVDAFVRLK